MSFTITINTLEALDAFLLTSSYVEGFHPTQADVKLLAFVGANVDAQRYPNVARWLNHINSFSAGDRAKFPAEKSAVTVQGKASAASGSAAPKPAAAAADDDDFDPFADDGDDAPAENPVSAIAAAKAAQTAKVGPVGKSSILMDIKPWDAETNLDDLAGANRGIHMEGLSGVLTSLSTSRSA
eukprot:EC796313.1.p1 GENE.EC796313.1~~EC796313.1.p1  ORF type:complete len:183 (+),score=79.97 EC796313.1:77-625(+)